jgi:hypothetical protein
MSTAPVASQVAPTLRRPPSRQLAQRMARAAGAVALACAGVAPAMGQTVIVTNAAPNSAVEYVLNGNVVGTGTVNAEDTATIAAPAAAGVTADIDAFVFVDTCDARRRVVIVERNQNVPAPPAGCTRQQVSGLFLVRSISTVVINAATPGQLLLRQGAYNPAEPPRTWGTAPLGVILFGGAGFTSLSKAPTNACGNAPDCTSDGNGIGFTGGGAFWLTPFIGAEATYIRPADTSADGGGTNYRFTSSTSMNLLTLTGNVGAPVGRVRIYGKVGANYFHATYNTSQTVQDKTITVDGETQVIPGGTQTLQYNTGGWGWTVGGGAEFWLTRLLGIYGDFSYSWLSGQDLDGGDAETQDKLLAVFGGVRVHIGK